MENLNVEQKYRTSLAGVIVSILASDAIGVGPILNIRKWTLILQNNRKCRAATNGLFSLSIYPASLINQLII